MALAAAATRVARTATDASRVATAWDQLLHMNRMLGCL